MSLGGSGVSIGGVKILRVGKMSSSNFYFMVRNGGSQDERILHFLDDRCRTGFCC